MYIIFYVVPIHFTEKICSRHVRRWAGVSAHTRKKKNRDIIRKLGNVKKSQNFIELWLSVQSSSRPPKMKILSILAKNF